MNPVRARHAWFLVLLTGIAASVGVSRWLATQEHRALRAEITHRSQAKLQAIRALIEQHVDVARTVAAILAHEPITNAGAHRNAVVDLVRDVMRLHPDSIVAMALIPATGRRDAVFMGRNGPLEQPDPPVDMSTLPRRSAGTVRLELTFNGRRSPILRLIMSTGASAGHAVVDLDATYILARAVTAGLPAGLDIEVSVLNHGREQRLFRHASRTRTTADDEEARAEYNWRGGFETAGMGFIMRAHAAPRLVRRFITPRPLLALLFGLAFTSLAALTIRHRIRFGDRLRREVEQRTRQLEGERQKLASIIDHASECVLLLNESGHIERANPAVSRVFDHPPDALANMSVHDLVPDDIREAHHHWFASEMATGRHAIMGKTRELKARRKNGAIFPVEVTVNHFMTEEGRRLSVILRDITRRGQREWAREALLAMRAISQERAPLHARLRRMLDRMFGDPWEFLGGAGAIFLVREDRLVLTASHGWSGADRQRCARVALGECLCGLAAQRGEPLFQPHRPTRHKLAGTNRPDAGYLCLPLMQGDTRLGLVILRLKPGRSIPAPFHDFCRQAEEILTAAIARERAREALKASERKYRRLVESTPLGIIIHERGIVRFANPAIATMLGADSPRDLLGRNALDHVADAFRETARQHLSRPVGSATMPIEARLTRLDGGAFWAEISGIATTFERRPAVQLLIQDITARKQAEERLAWLSGHDELTGLANRRLFADRAEQALALADRNQSTVAVLYLDLDRFKFINDSLGHATGDRILRQVAARLNNTLRKSDTAARLGGDEFAALLQNASAVHARRAADRIRETLRRPMRVNGQEYVLDVSIGIAIFPQDGRDFDTLLKRADTAMYHSKRDPLRIHYFSGAMETQISRRLLLEQALGRAVKQRRLQLHYQTLHLIRESADATTRAVAGVEALARWPHPTLGMIPPGEFIPLAEETGLIAPITQWALTEAGRQAAAWEQAGARPGRIGVNISAAQLMQWDLAREILACLRDAHARPEWISIEITETATMREPEVAIAVMSALADAGISIAIDDFGAGYSSLSYLKRLPAEWLKIDSTFIRGLPADADNAAIVRSTIAMAHALGKKIIAEGVETTAQLDFLRAAECDAAQGFLFGRPRPADAISDQLRGSPETPPA